MFDEIKTRFTYHKPSEDQTVIYTDLRYMSGQLACSIVDLVPDCRERKIALQKLEEMVMWANAGVARRS